MTPEERAEDCIQKWQDGDYQPTVLEDVLRDAITAAIAEEREACAHIAENPATYDAAGGWGYAGTAVGNVRAAIAAAIRART